MGLEDYLCFEKYSILAINTICKMLFHKISENFYSILKGQIDKKFLDDLEGLLTAILMITYCMRIYNKESYQTFEPYYKDDFTYNSMMFEDCF